MFKSKILSFNTNLFTIILIFSDVASAILAFFVAYFLRNKGVFRLFLDSVQPIEVYLTALPFAILILLIIFAFTGLYEPKQRVTRISEMYNSLRAVTLWALLIMTGSYLYKFDYSRIIVILMYFFTSIFIVLGRLIVRNFQINFAKNGFGTINVLIVGTGKPAREIARRLARYKDIGFNLIGFIDDKVNDSGKVLGGLRKLNKIIKKYNIHEVYISDPTLSHEAILTLVARSNSSSTKFKVVSNVFDLVTGSVDIANLESIPSLDVGRTHFPWWKKFYKRTFDILFSGIALVITLPLWLIIYFAIKLDSDGPAIFTQERVGEEGKSFRMFKFRTMINDTPPYNKAPKELSDMRITQIGKALRRFSLDELPQLINIIRGEMSVVGPRPEMPFIVKKYTYWERKRLEVKPGLTGLWQILGRKDLPLSENLEYDFYYINNQSFMLDIVIILKTIPIVVRGKGAY